MAVEIGTNKASNNKVFDRANGRLFKRIDLTRKRAMSKNKPEKRNHKKAKPTAKKANGSYNGVWVVGVIAFVTLAVYWQVHQFDFINFDDPKYVTENKYVQMGLSWASMKWAFTATAASNWHPVTWLSHILDYEMFGLNAGVHHSVNLFFHIANTVLLFLVFRRMTRELWQSAIVAALFALHPLHVESVAWIAERKDMLSTFFGLMMILAYIWFTQKGGLFRYLLVIVLFATGLMAKPMLVTLPFVLLLLDYWPLKRFKKIGNHPGVSGLLAEKVPLFILSAVSCVITMRVQQKVVIPIEGLDAYSRIGNALISYSFYIYKMIWPVELSVFYPHPGKPDSLSFFVAAVFLVGLTILVFWYGFKHRYLTVGWFWYLGTLIPVIGLVQVGHQRYADRYTYIPLIGLFVILAWLGADLSRRLQHKAVLLWAVSMVVLMFFATGTWFQASYWRDSVTLYEHSLAVTEDNHLAHNNLGVVLLHQGRIDDAIFHWEKALEVYPQYGNAMANLGSTSLEKGEFDRTIKLYGDFLQKHSGNCELHNNFGNALRKKHRLDEAIRHYKKALEFKPDAWQVYYNLGMVLTEKGELDKATEHYRESLRLNPNSKAAKIRLENLLKKPRKQNK